MADLWWVQTWFQQLRDFQNLRVWSQTNHPAHLLMKWAYIQPARTPIYRVLRGKIVFCGYRYVWDSPNLAEQIESGDTINHTFHLPSIDPSQYVWYYLFSPIGPYGLECQGPLMMSPPMIAHLWTTKAYIGTREKGIFYTSDFTGPGGPQPTWYTRNEGLDSLKVWQMQADPLGIAYQQYALTGEIDDRTLYRRWAFESYAWQPILTTPMAEALTGGTNGKLHWITTGINRPAYLYVLFTCDFPPVSCFLLRSPDQGAAWSVHTIYDAGSTYEAGNLEIGIVQGSSPHDAGDVLYAVLHPYPAAVSNIYRSLDNGDTWTYGDHNNLSNYLARLLVDPTDQAVTYIGGRGPPAHRRALWRSTDHADNYANVSDDHNQGTFIDPYRANAWIDPTDHQFIRTLQDQVFWTSDDYAASWKRQGTTWPPCQVHTALWEHPTHIYLARSTSSDPYPFPGGAHVIFVSDDEGVTQHGKSGEHPEHFEGMKDSIPWNCGGVCHNGIQLFPPY